MKTYEASLVSSSWTEILGDETSIYLDINGPSHILMNFSENGVPALDAPSLRVYPSKGGWDFEASGLKVGQRIYARSYDKPTDIVVVR